MDYEVVELKEKKVIGLCARTSNTDPEAGAVIGGLWSKLYQEGICDSIPNKVNEKALGIYSDYSSDEKGAYDITVAYEVSEIKELPAGAVSKVIPAGKYAKFVVEGDVQRAVGEFWQKLWQMDLDRAFTADFEEYQDSDMENAKIHMYIALR